MPFGVLTLDRAGFVLDANRAAREITSRGDGLRIERGRLRAVSSDDQAALDAGIGRACTAGCGAELLVARPSLLRPWHVLVSPASPCVRSEVIDLFDRRPAALVFVSDPEAAPRSSIEAIAALFGLTPAEARLAAALAAGRSIDEYAEEAGLSRETARQYLKRVFQKTGTRRQGELVAKLLRSVASLEGD